MDKNYDDMYKESVQLGLEFEDYLAEKLMRLGIILNGYASKKYENEIGENALGAEIKRDGKFRETGNLYIETGERKDTAREFVDSGIFRNDNSWLYIIGDEETVWIFGKKWLVRAYESGDRAFPAHVGETNRGFLMLTDIANMYCLRRIELGNIK